MCFAALLNGDARGRPIAALVRRELPAAVRTGVVAAAAVAVVLVTAGGGPAAVGSRAAAALALAVGLHTAVLVAGIAVLRVHTGLRDGTGSTPLETR